MKPRKAGGRHLTPGEVLDLLEGRVTGAERARLEDHVAAPCERCREALRAAGELLEVMRRDRSADVPAALHRIALDAFAAMPEPAPGPGLVQRVARLLFDSASSPAPVTARRAVGASRLLRFEVGASVLELECEIESATEATVRGRLDGPEPALHRIDLEFGEERRTAWPDAEGRFALESVPRGRVRITVDGPTGRHRIPALEV